MARLLEGRYADCAKVILVCDNLNTHTIVVARDQHLQALVMIERSAINPVALSPAVHSQGVERRPELLPRTVAEFRPSPLGSQASHRCGRPESASSLSFVHSGPILAKSHRLDRPDSSRLWHLQRGFSGNVYRLIHVSSEKAATSVPTGCRKCACWQELTKSR